MTRPRELVCRTFQVCRRVIRDEFTREVVLIGPMFQLQVNRLPFIASVSLFIRVTDGEGEYQINLRLQDQNGIVIWDDSPGAKLTLANPLAIGEVVVNGKQLAFPKAGLYELHLLANGAEIHREPLMVTALRSPQK